MKDEKDLIVSMEKRGWIGFLEIFFFLKLQVREDCHLVGGRNWGGI